MEAGSLTFTPKANRRHATCPDLSQVVGRVGTPNRGGYTPASLFSPVPTAASPGLSGVSSWGQESTPRLGSDVSSAAFKTATDDEMDDAVAAVSLDNLGVKPIIPNLRTG